LSFGLVNAAYFNYLAREGWSKKFYIDKVALSVTIFSGRSESPGKHGRWWNLWVLTRHGAKPIPSCRSPMAQIFSRLLSASRLKFLIKLFV
jgi:hypothetical protein